VIEPYYQDKWVTIYHGDCREILPELPDRPDLVFTDPPYISSQLGRWGKLETMNGTDDYFWVLPSFREISRVMLPDSFLLSFYGWRNADIFLWTWRACGLSPVSHIIWVKNNWGLGQFTRAQHESAYLLVKGKPKPAKVISDVLKWEGERNKDIIAQKPINAVTPLLEALGGTLTLDPFLGSGTTVVACKKLNRRSIGIEIEEKYCEIAANRCRQSVMEFND